MQLLPYPKSIAFSSIIALMLTCISAGEPISFSSKDILTSNTDNFKPLSAALAITSDSQKLLLLIQSVAPESCNAAVNFLVDEINLSTGGTAEIKKNTIWESTPIGLSSKYPWAGALYYNASGILYAALLYIDYPFSQIFLYQMSYNPSRSTVNDPNLISYKSVALFYGKSSQKQRVDLIAEGSIIKVFVSDLDHPDLFIPLNYNLNDNSWSRLDGIPEPKIFNTFEDVITFLNTQNE